MRTGRKIFIWLMRKIIFPLFCLLILSFGAKSGITEDAKYKITPNEDKNSPTGIYVPKNLDECFSELKKMLSPELVEEMQTGNEADMAQYHHGLGMWLRNNWGLWSGSRLKRYFNNLGINHPDDMSGIILDSFWRNLNHKPVELENQVKYYQEYWRKVKEKGQ